MPFEGWMPFTNLLECPIAELSTRRVNLLHDTGSYVELFFLMKQQSL